MGDSEAGSAATWAAAAGAADGPTARSVTDVIRCESGTSPGLASLRIDSWSDTRDAVGVGVWRWATTVDDAVGPGVPARIEPARQHGEHDWQPSP